MLESRKIAELTFVTVKSDNTLDLWTPERHPDYATANAQGRDYAAELLLFIRMTNNPQVFGQVMRAITRAGVYDAVEIGFCHAVGIELVGLPIVAAQAVDACPPPRAAAA